MQGRLENRIWQGTMVNKERSRYPLIEASVEVGRRTMLTMGEATLPSPLLPIEEAVKRRGERIDRKRVKDMIIGREWPTVEQLRGMISDGPQALCRSLKVKHLLNSLPPPEYFKRPLTKIEEICTGEGQVEHVLSRIYKVLEETETMESMGFVAKWSRDLRRNLSGDVIGRVIRSIHGLSRCNSTQEQGYKLWAWWYRTPSLLHKIYPQVTDRCWRCQREEGTLIHIFWACPKLWPFWSKVRKIIQGVTNHEVKMDPAFFLLPLQRSHGENTSNQFCPS